MLLNNSFYLQNQPFSIYNLNILSNVPFFLERMERGVILDGGAGIDGFLKGPSMLIGILTPDH